MTPFHRSTGNQNISIIGMGYVGLPTALAFHDAGYNVTGVDVSKQVIEILSRGEVHLVDDHSDLKIPVDSDRWKVTCSFSESVRYSDIVIITVPTPVNSDKTPDLGYVRSAFESVLRNIDVNRKSIVVLESTVFPGVTNSIAKEIASKRNLRVGEDFDLAYSPERVSPGEIGKGASDVTRIVGSEIPEVGILLTEVYSGITTGGCSYVGKMEVAEAAKMIENTQRDIDIAFVNELSTILPKMGLDVMEVLDAASTKWNFHRHTPGIGVGGHCIPVDPYYYIQCSKEVGSISTLSPSARHINESMPEYSAKQISEILGGTGSILILGLAYKPNVGDIRETPVLQMINALANEGIASKVWDPFIRVAIDLPEKCKLIDDPYVAADGADMVVLATGHDACINLDWGLIKEKLAKPVLFDGPRVLNREKLELMGWKYTGVGNPNEENN